MNVIEIPIIVAALRATVKNLEKRLEVEIQRRTEISENTQESPRGLKRLSVTQNSWKTTSSKWWKNLLRLEY